MQALDTAAMGQIRSGGGVKAVVLAAEVQMKESIFGYHVSSEFRPLQLALSPFQCRANCKRCTCAAFQPCPQSDTFPANPPPPAGFSRLWPGR